MLFFRPFWPLLFGLFFVAVGAEARPFRPPPQRGYVNGVTSKLLPEEVRAFDSKLDDYRLCSTNHVVVVLVDGNYLGETSIDDAARATLVDWKLGEPGRNNGVVFMLSTNTGQGRVVVGEGVAERLTQEQAGRIMSEKVLTPLQDQRFFDAIEVGTNAIGAALGGCAMKPTYVERQQPVSIFETQAPYGRAASSGELPLPSVFVQCVFYASAVVGLFALMFSALSGFRASWLIRLVFASLVAGVYFLLFVPSLKNPTDRGFSRLEQANAFETATLWAFFLALPLVCLNIGILIRRWWPSKRSGGESPDSKSFRPTGGGPFGGGPSDRF